MYAVSARTSREAKVHATLRGTKLSVEVQALLLSIWREVNVAHAAGLAAAARVMGEAAAALEREAELYREGRHLQPHGVRLQRTATKLRRVLKRLMVPT